MKPAWTREPITGIRWLATSRGAYWLAYVPALVALAAFGLGVAVGRAWW